MRKILLTLVAASALFMAGCTEQEVQFINKYTVVTAPDSMYRCPVITKWPAIKTLTQLQTAKIIVNLAENNRICKSSLDSIKSYYNSAKQRIESQQAAPSQRRRP